MISFMGLALEVTLTRIFSATMTYHYAFMAVSVALLGLGFGGIAIHFLKKRIRAMTLDTALIALLACSISMPVCILSMLQFQFSQDYINLYFIISFVPFFLAGMPLAFFYSENVRSANKLYLADLAGASFACAVVESTIALFGPESTILLLGVIGSIACMFLVAFVNKRRFATLSIIVFLVTSTFFAVNVQSGFGNISNGTKRMFKILQDRPELNVTFTRWNSFSRVDVVEGVYGPNRVDIFIDGDADTEIVPWDGRIESLGYMRDTLDFLPYYLVENPKTLVIGSGGGKDVLFALVGNSSKVTAVELNPLVIDAVQKYKDRTNDLYNNPKVELHVDEGRSFIRGSNEKFDVMDLTLVDSWAAISGGSYALAENYLYTEEAFADYINHLTDKGLLVMVRWKSEVPRLVSTITEAYATQGEDAQSVGKHVALIVQETRPGEEDWGAKALLVLKKGIFTETEANVLLNRTSVLEPLYQALYLPHVKNSVTPYSKLFNGSISLGQFYEEFSNRVDAIKDDSPYFFNTDKIIPKTLSDLTFLALSLCVLSIAIPWMLIVRSHKKKVAAPIVKANPNRFSLVLLVVFFSALGLGYMLVEIAAIQKFLLFLGYPTRVLAVILFSLLLSSGIGGFVSGRLATEHMATLKKILVACMFVIIVASIYIFALPRIFELLLPLDSAIRIAATILLIFPLGFFMGMPFPLGISMLHGSSNGSIPWVWGINGSMSVLGSTLAAVSGVILGFSYAILFGALVYSIALVCAIFWMKRKTEGL